MSGRGRDPSGPPLRTVPIARGASQDYNKWLKWQMSLHKASEVESMQRDPSYEKKEHKQAFSDIGEPRGARCARCAPGGAGRPREPPPPAPSPPQPGTGAS